MVLFRFRFWLCCFTWNYISSVFATFSPSCSWQKGDRPDNGDVEPCSNQPKKSLIWKYQLWSASFYWPEPRAISDEGHFLLAAAWICPGRSVLQSAEQRWQRRYGHRPNDVIHHQNIKQKTCKRPRKFKQNHPTSPEVQRTPTLEWERQVDTSVKTEGFGEIQKEITCARATESWWPL